MGIIRFLLAISVVLAHGGSLFGINLLGGQTAVQIFYIFSGFYMSLILNQKYVEKNSSFKLFFTNRLLRLVPIYWVVLFLTLFFSIAIIFFSHGQNLNKFSLYFESNPSISTIVYLICSQIFIVGLDLATFLGFDSATGQLFYTSNFHVSHPEVPSFLFIPQAWTLAIEIYFYIFAPFILRRSTKFVIILMSLSLLLRVFLFNYFNFRLDPWTYRFFPTELFFFLLGFISYKLLLYFSQLRLSNILVSFIVILSFIFVFTFQYIPDLKFYLSPFSLKEVFIYCYMTFSVPFLFLKFKNNNLDIKIGELSFPIYIVHMSIIPFVNLFNLSHSSFLILILTVFSAIALNRYVGIPIEKFRNSRLIK
jgi:peptidoglycan/LPS O-acetylase OafA/YrhL